MRKICHLLFSLLLTIIMSCSDEQSSTLRVAHIYDPLAGLPGKANVEWLKKVVAEFQRINPSYKIVLEQIQWDQIDSKSMADFQAQIPHDIVWTSPQLMPKHIQVGDLKNLSPYIHWSQEENEEFQWSPVWGKAERKGKRLGIPLGVHTRTVAYRRDMFEQVGLNPDAPPKDLDELIAAAKALTRDTNKDGKPDIWGLGIYFGPSRGTIEIGFAPLLWHFGGKLWDEQTKQAVFASEAGIKAARFIYDLIYVHQVTPKWVVSGTYDDVISRNFLNGKFAMAWGWGSYWIQILEEKGWIEGLFPPTIKGKAKIADVFVIPTNGSAQFTNAWTISIHSLSTHPQKSFEFIQMIVKPEILIRFPDAGLPARKSEWMRPEYLTPFYQTWYRAAQAGKSMPFTAYYMDLADVVASALQEILVTQAPIPETLKKFQDEYNARFAGE